MQHTVDINNCEKEPIHIPGRVQSHGFLLTVREHDLSILQVSANIADFTGLEPHGIPGRSLRDFLPEHKIQFILDLLREGDIEALNPLLLRLNHDTDRAYNCIVNRAPDVLLMEFEPAAEEDIEQADHVFHLLNTINTHLRSAGSVEQLCRTVCSEVRSYTGYDRVMLYRFDEEWNGEVLAEARAKELHSFEGHHYPASDIPRQARELFRRNWIRIIPDVNYTPADILPQHTATDTDLTYSVLRNVSPIHIQYLKNMEVGASLTISIIIDNRLWGMIACHHRTPKFVDYGRRKVCELIGKMFSSHILFKEESDEAAYTKRIRDLEEDLYQQMHREMNILNAISNGDRSLLQITGAEGVAINYRGRVYTLGTTPAPEQIDQLYYWLSQQSFNDIYYTNSLQHYFPNASEFTETASGIVAIPISRSSEEYVVWFRPELVQTVRWAGNPDKAAEFDTETMQISPRKSFEVWKQVVYGKSAPWKKAEINNALLLHMHMQEVILREYRQIGQSAAAGISQQQHLEIRVLEQTIELQRRQQQLQAQLEQSRNQEHRLHYAHLLASGMMHLLRNRLANMSLSMSQSIMSFLGGMDSGHDTVDTERAMKRLLEYSHKFTDLSRMEYHSSH